MVHKRFDFFREDDYFFHAYFEMRCHYIHVNFFVCNLQKYMYTDTLHNLVFSFTFIIYISVFYIYYNPFMHTCIIYSVRSSEAYALFYTSIWITRTITWSCRTHYWTEFFHPPTHIRVQYTLYLVWKQIILKACTKWQQIID